MSKLFDYCPECGHHRLIHNEDGCEMRIMQSGYPDFASLHKCGCNHYKEKGNANEDTKDNQSAA